MSISFTSWKDKKPKHEQSIAFIHQDLEIKIGIFFEYSIDIDSDNFTQYVETIDGNHILHSEDNMFWVDYHKAMEQLIIVEKN